MRHIMAMYCIGDIQGCDAELAQLLDVLDFSPSRHSLCVLGDMVNRGPHSAAVLRRLMALEGSAHCLLGNHDIHLLAVAHGLRARGRRDTFDDVLQAPDRERLLHWLRHRELALCARECLMVHAGVQPAWSVAQTLGCAAEISAALRAPHWREALRQLFGDTPVRWSQELRGVPRQRAIVNTLTRLRFIDATGHMDFAHKRGLEDAPAQHMPWFEHPQRQSASQLLVFGHWSALGLVQRKHLLGLDTGCVWGGVLSAARITRRGSVGEIVQVRSLQQ